jgi:hypothetical protein
MKSCDKFKDKLIKARINKRIDVLKKNKKLHKKFVFTFNIFNSALTKVRKKIESSKIINFKSIFIYKKVF